MNINKKYIFFYFITIVFILIPFLTENIVLWKVLGIQRMIPYFFDLHVLLTAIDSHHLGFDVLKENPLCKYNITHVYSKFWFVLKYIGFSEINRCLIGFISIFLFLISIIFLVKRNICIFLLLICSPAVLLAIERCNNDIIIFLLLLSLTPLAISKSKTKFIISHILLFLAIMLKYYPVAYSVVYLLRSDTLSNRLKSLVIQCVFFISWIIFCWEDLQIQKSSIPDPLFYSCFGIFPLVSQLSYIFNIQLLASWILVLILSLVYLVIISKVLRKELILSNNKQKFKNFNNALCLGGIAVLLFCYLIRTSFDYRMIYLFFSLTYLINFSLNYRDNFIYIFISPIFLLILFTISAWSECLVSITVLLLQNYDYGNLLPYLLFILRSFELTINHFSFMTLFAYGLIQLFNTRKSFLLDHKI